MDALSGIAHDDRRAITGPKIVAPVSGTEICGISVVVPTRNEAGNVRPLLERLAAHRAGLIREVLYVDDSDDDTAAVIEAESAGRPFTVRLLHREPGERVNGLSGAVIEGLRLAHGDWVCVIDGDLQHPPEFIAELAARGAKAGARLMCATRYTGSGDNGGLAFGRSVVSRASTLAAKAMFPRALAGVSDPMSGFFVVHREAVDTDRLRPRGFKILLEILVRHPGLGTVEASYKFDERMWGDTKASLRQGFEYVVHLCTLRLSAARPRLSTTRSGVREPRTEDIGRDSVANQELQEDLVHHHAQDAGDGASVVLRDPSVPRAARLPLGHDLSR